MGVEIACTGPLVLSIPLTSTPTTASTTTVPSPAASRTGCAASPRRRFLPELRRVPRPGAAGCPAGRTVRGGAAGAPAVAGDGGAGRAGAGATGAAATGAGAKAAAGACQPGPAGRGG